MQGKKIAWKDSRKRPRFKIIITQTYERRLSVVEDFIFELNQSIVAVEEFLTDHDRVLNFIRENAEIPSYHEEVGERSWPFFKGRYRLFFKVVRYRIYLLDLIDNRMMNLQVYPMNTFPIYEEE